MITYIILTLITIRAIFLSKQDRDNTLFFVLMCSTLLMFGYHLPAEHFAYYYWACAFFDLLIISTISQQDKISSNSISLIFISLALIYLNLFGLISYEAYISSRFYTFYCNLVYLSFLLYSFRGLLSDRFGINKNNRMDNLSNNYIDRRTLSLSEREEAKEA